MKRSPRLVEIIPDVLYWISDNKMLVYDSVPGAYMYNCDYKYKYKAYNQDFGPVTLSQITKYIREMAELVRENNLAGGRDPTRKRVVHLTSGRSEFASNSSVLMGAYMIFELGMTTEEIATVFKKGKSNLF